MGEVREWGKLERKVDDFGEIDGDGEVGGGWRWLWWLVVEELRRSGGSF